MKKQALILMLMGAFTLPSSLWAMQECEDIPVVYCGRFPCSPNNVTAELALPPASGQIALAVVIGSLNETRYKKWCALWHEAAEE